jgi:hypothetical protein
LFFYQSVAPTKRDAALARTLIVEETAKFQWQNPIEHCRKSVDEESVRVRHTWNS